MRRSRAWRDGRERERGLVRHGDGVLLRSEYVAQRRDNNGFLTDLYVTFFNRAPDAGGFAYWSG
jgi:hypothetical protein